MSLYKQLWLAIIVLLTVAFGAAIVVNSQSSRAYLEQQLRIKNTDDATALASVLSQQDGDRAGLENALATQFDSGSYEFIEIRDPAGKALIYRVADREVTGAPAWFISLLPINADPGTAPVFDGDRQLGTLNLRTQSGFAYRELWSGTQKMAIIFLSAVILGGALGSYLLKKILSPLGDVVEQARAIGEKRFVNIPEPRTLELRKVVNSMNRLSERTEHMLRQEGRRLDKLQRDSRQDKITGLMNREPFLWEISSTLAKGDHDFEGFLCLIRVRGLAQLNQIYGRKAIDAMLKDMGNGLNRIVVKNSGWNASRMNGSDFAVLAPGASDPLRTAKDVQSVMREVLATHSMPKDVRLPGAATLFDEKDTTGELLNRLDGALLAVDKEGGSSISIARRGDIGMKPIREQMKQWRHILDKAFKEHLFFLERLPVTGKDGELLHMECRVCLDWQGTLFDADELIPWINRLELSADLDQEIIGLSLTLIEREGQPLCISLSNHCVVQANFLSWVGERLSSHAAAAEKLWLEVSEAAVFSHLDEFRLLANKLKDYGCKVGIAKGGHQLAELGRLHDLGLDFFKVDNSFIQNIENNSANRTLFSTLSAVGHSVGLLVITGGTGNDSERSTLIELGADGVTGPGTRG